MNGAMLEANYTAYQSSSLQKILTNGNIFGLGIHGDGATIGKIPMMNILAASAGNPNCVIDIILAQVSIWISKTCTTFSLQKDQ